MWIINQDRTKVCYCTNIEIEKLSFKIVSNSDTLGEYNSLEECQKIFEDIIDGIRYQHIMYSMPKSNKK